MLPGGNGALAIRYSQFPQSYRSITALKQTPLDEFTSMYFMHLHYSILRILVKHFFACFF